MKKTIKIWITNAISLWIIDAIFGTSIQFNGAGAVLATALALTIFEATIKPILKVLALPVSILTFGLFSLVINALVLELAFAMSTNSYIASFGTAFIASIILTIVVGFVEKVLD